MNTRCINTKGKEKPEMRKVEASGFRGSELREFKINIHEPPKGEREVGLSVPVKKSRE
jgi:hypothetical protein